MTDARERPVVFVNGAPVALWNGAHWRDAVTAWYAAAGAALASEAGWMTDAAGELVDPGGAIVPGAAIGWQWANPNGVEMAPRRTPLDTVPDGD
ncbi:MAG: hypothetical protein ABR559_07795 [Gemmatimonadota bacterium]